MINFDIFFIDFERPKSSNDHNFFHGSNKSHPGTPSISSSLKPTISSPSPTNECVSAWRNYFIANEWQELMTKRKISIHLHVVFVVGALLVSACGLLGRLLSYQRELICVSRQIFGFQNFASPEFHLHLNQTRTQSYLSLLGEDDSNGNIMLKVAVGAAVYLTLYLAQRLYNFLIYERFVDNCLQQFIDVSSIANISVLILLDSYGFYVHGRSG